MSTELTVPGSSSILNKKIRSSDLILTVLIDLAAAFSILLLIAIMGYVFFRGLPQISLSFLTSVPSTIKGTFGIAGNIVNTLYIIILTLLIATPIGVGSAIYLNEYAKPGKNRPADRIYDRNPFRYSFYHFRSVWYGIFGTTLGLGYSILTGALTLTLMVLPLITRNTQEALKTVPATYRSGALGIGCNQMVHDPHNPAPLRNARHYHRYHSCDRTYRRRIRRPFYSPPEAAIFCQRPLQDFSKKSSNPAEPLRSSCT